MPRRSAREEDSSSESSGSEEEVSSSEEEEEELMCTDAPVALDDDDDDVVDPDDDNAYDEDDGVRHSHMAATGGRGNDRGKLWNVGATIRVRFLNGSSSETRREVQRYAKIWEQYANITFQFVTDNRPAQIRISFKPNDGWHSKIGKDALRVEEPKPTMNLAVTRNTSQSSLRAYVLHEFGHALGCIHEHSSPSSGIKWNKPVVYEDYRRKMGWDKKKVDSNIFFKYTSRTITQFTQFDRLSIMVYWIPAKYTTDGRSVPWNTNLSPTDKRYIARLYPGRR